MLARDHACILRLLTYIACCMAWVKYSLVYRHMYVCKYIDGCMIVFPTCTARYICNIHAFYLDMHEQVHKVIGIKDVLLDVRGNVGLTLDNDRVCK